MLELVGLGQQASRYPAPDVRRPAAARRARARTRDRAQVLLLDEPLSALDAKVRRQLREEIRRIQIMIGITTLFVTHDQEEALAMGDRVGVMSAGRLEQIAPPAELYDRPKTPFRGRVRRADEPDPCDGQRRHRRSSSGRTVPAARGLGRSPGPVQALVRPENVRLVRGRGRPTRVSLAVSFLGSLCRAQVTLPDETLVVAPDVRLGCRAGSIRARPSASASMPAPVFAVAGVRRQPLLDIPAT